MIHALLDTTKVVGTLDHEGGSFEVCAEATANHARGDNLLNVNLRSYLRSTRHVDLGAIAIPDWLPAPQVVTEHVAIDEAHEMTNEIFASWCRKVAESIPH